MHGRGATAAEAWVGWGGGGGGRPACITEQRPPAAFGQSSPSGHSPPSCPSMVAPTLYRSILRAAARLKDPRTGLIQFTEPVNARMWGHGPPPTPTLPPPLSRPWTSETLARPAVNCP